MTLWDVLTVIGGLAPFFVGLSNGRQFGLVGVITGGVIGLSTGVIAFLLSRKAGLLIFNRLLRAAGRQPALIACVTGFVYLTLVGWVFAAAFTVTLVMNAWLVK